jgi:magnesium chelatase subunit I
VQVSLFNIMQEGDVQIKGYPLRLELDVLLVFSANPEDYTARGKIVTPLKDRIGSEIRTHYPATVGEGMAITRQEAWLGEDSERAFVPSFVAELIEEVAFQAREDQRVDKQSGVSQRLPISLLELAASNAERRALVAGDEPVARPADVYASLSAITGKLELEYEGELKGADKVAQDIIRKAAGVVFARRLPRADSAELEKWFEQGHTLALPITGGNRATIREARQVPKLLPLARELVEGESDAHVLAAIEFVLEGLVGRKKISRSEEHGNYAAAQGEEVRTGGRKTRWN